ncbi:MAG: hypothetical protein HGA45_15275, partial [Chloroflexales bacterium]|nr:hypothetical protein [Chloroflexales bacterium]
GGYHTCALTTTGRVACWGSNLMGEVGARLLLYGTLADEPSAVPPERLIFDGLRVEGFYLMEWKQRRGYLRALQGLATIQRFAAEVPPTVRACFPLAEAPAAVALYRGEMGAGKVLLMPGLERGGRAVSPHHPAEGHR